jgi:hypothetical protein
LSKELHEDNDMSGGVFISYRREDSPSAAGRIYDRLKSRLGSERVFFDIDSIGLGVDFVEVLSENVGKCDALVAVIGRNWVSSAGNDNRRRLDDPGDFVRIEIEAALERDIPVIPVLVDDAEMPRTEDLPDGLKKLTRRQGIQVSHTRFDFDVDRLTHALSWVEDEIHKREEREKTKIERKPEQAHPLAGEHLASGLGAQVGKKKGATEHAVLQYLKHQQKTVDDWWSERAAKEYSITDWWSDQRKNWRWRSK